MLLRKTFIPCILAEGWFVLRNLWLVKGGGKSPNNLPHRSVTFITLTVFIKMKLVLTYAGPMKIS